MKIKKIISLTLMSCLLLNCKKDKKTDPQIKITSVSPSFGFAGSEVRLIGIGFSAIGNKNSKLSVQMNNQTLFVKTYSETELTVVLPKSTFSGRIEIKANGNTLTAIPDRFVIIPNGYKRARIKKISDNQGRLSEYFYESNNRLVKFVIYSLPDPVTNIRTIYKSEEYTYNANGIPIRMESGGTVRSYNYRENDILNGYSDLVTGYWPGIGVTKNTFSYTPLYVDDRLVKITKKHVEPNSITESLYSYEFVADQLKLTETSDGAVDIITIYKTNIVNPHLLFTPNILAPSILMIDEYRHPQESFAYSQEVTLDQEEKIISVKQQYRYSSNITTYTYESTQ